MNELHLFAGAGGGILGGILCGHTTVCAVEWDKHARQVLLARQRDGCLPRFPIWDDVQTFDGKPWRGRVDVVCGGFPCQDISSAGKGAGIEGERSGMWFHMARIIGEIRPKFILVENSPMLTIRGLGRVLGDLAAMGYDAEWGVLGAKHIGGLHGRRRLWIVANAATDRRGLLSDDGKKREQRWASAARHNRTDTHPLKALPAAEFWGGTDGVPKWLDQGWRMVGNAQVPGVAAVAFKLLSARLNDSEIATAATSLTP